MTVPQRPSPESLLHHAQREDDERSRGRLKIYFGAAPGVGKTYAMLAAAQRLAREGVDVVVGIVETHGRSETEQMLLGLDILPRRKVEYRGVDGKNESVLLSEFDLEAALHRKPDILILDELAHTNAVGSKYEKRFQDLEEILRAGIHVYTTLNVQHIESLNDVVAQITGIRVRETVPDSVIENADEIELVDLPPEVLLERLKAGRIYVPQNVQAARDSFFRAGNLTALREIALRKTAEWVDTQMRDYKQGKGIRAVWPAAERVIVTVSPAPSSAKIVRAAKRMAAGLHAELLAVYVQTPGRAALAQSDHERLDQTLRLATSLGAEIVMLSGENAAAEIINFARTRNVSKIVVGKTGQSRLREAIFGSFVHSLIHASGDIDVYVIRGDADDNESRVRLGLSGESHHRAGILCYVYGIAIVTVATVLGLVVLKQFDLANIVMMYLAGVVLAAMWLGRGPAVLTTVLGVAAFDFFFVAPQLTFAVSDIQYVITFIVMLVVGLLIANLTTRLRVLAESSRDGEMRTSLLYALSRELAGAREVIEVASVAVRHVYNTFDCDVSLLMPRKQSNKTDVVELDIIATAGLPDWLEEHEGREKGVARYAYDHSKQAGKGTASLPGAAGRFQPLVATQGKIGLLAIRPRDERALQHNLQGVLFDTFINQISLSLERVMLIDGQQTARIEAESERLRSALLSSVSHDLRTPLATISGAATTLQSSGTLSETARREMVDSIVTEAEHLNDLIANLMFATRLEAGAIQLRLEWTSVEEIVGSSLSRLRDALRARPFQVRLPSDLPLIRVDNALLPQVIHNLVDNAIRYTPAGTAISVSAWATDVSIVVKVADQGPGLSQDEQSKVFQRFYRGSAAKPHSERTGIGLGLTICEGIIKAHGGRIWVEPNSQYPPFGVAFMFSLPIDREQPSMPEESSDPDVKVNL